MVISVVSPPFKKGCYFFVFVLRDFSNGWCDGGLKSVLYFSPPFLNNKMSKEAYGEKGVVARCRKRKRIRFTNENG